MSETRILSAQEDDMKAAVREAAALLAKGEIVALPTETVYGLGADAFNADAVAKVFAAKERPAFDPLIVHISSFKELAEVAVVPEDIAATVKSLAGAFWPGPLTIVLPKTDKVPDLVTSGLPTVAVRQSANLIFRNVGKELGRPIAAPSANRFGRISPTSASAVLKELEGRIPLVIDGGACREGLESTIITIENRGGEQKPLIRVLRAGPVTKEELQKFGKVVIEKKSVTERPDAPGQLESHYAPRTPLLMFDKPEDFRPEPGKKYGLLSYRGDPKAGYMDLHEWETVEELSPGSGKLMEAAVRLFHVMRVLDEEGLDAIVAEPVSETGLGVAIMDRLRRASAK
ncbi:L-threonylcarbamoyladenylate synthase [Haloferula sp. BvORR071]|uniref:L-threonylcarbamoyladenylate synthase n=1 Tax=Haloferula sp. BvORR071 TaxID=1396141 RepID=UPI000AC3D9F6|nr:L-threonylcarbamoyladenylate synthase [Haloferula sp. BvORR071]